MNLQVLVSTMNQKDHSLVEKMNIQSDAIIINQCDRNGYEEFEHNGYSIKLISFAERGLGLSRETALMRATADICLFSDDDVIYENGYKQIIFDTFNENPKADIIFFNVPSTNPARPTLTIKKHSRVRFFNCMRYGSVKIAARTNKLKQENIHFSPIFGAGSKYSTGEDSLFITDCLKKGLVLMTNPKTIGYVKQEDSTWFKGYTDKYFMDKGKLYTAISKRFAFFLCLQFAIRYRKLYKNQKTFMRAMGLMIKGTSSKY